MNRTPSQRVSALIHTIETEPLSHDDIVGHLNIIRDEFQKDEAEAYRSLQAINMYYGVVVNELLPKSDELTGRE